MLRNRFLNSTAWFLAPEDGSGSGGEAGGNAGGSADASTQNGSPTGDEGKGHVEGNQQADADDETGVATDDGEVDDEDDDFADLNLSPEQKAAVQAKLERETRWRDRQIDRLHAKRRNAEADAEAAAAIAAGRVKPGEAATLTPEQIRIEAQRLNIQERYDADCNAADAAGRAAYGEKWGKALEKLPKMGGIEVPDMVNIMATDNPASVLYALGSNPDEYDRIMALPPARRATEFVKLGLKPLPKSGDKKDSKRPSTAAAPVTPITGGRATAAKSVNLYDDKVSDDDWYRVRNETRAKKFSNVV